ncbi:MAG: hypothetical protein PF693_08125 [Spirochaetia bacterium]|jgi:hypothetical protein|nr:hypothetical protein [Spirochaetia bacterium]
MDTVTIRQQLHESIENIDDLDLLSLVKDILDRKYCFDPMIEISDHQRNRISASLDSIESGNFLSDEQANKLVNNWLNQ